MGVDVGGCLNGWVRVRGCGCGHVSSRLLPSHVRACAAVGLRVSHVQVALPSPESDARVTVLERPEATDASPRADCVPVVTS